MGYYTTLSSHDVRWKDGTNEAEVLQYVKATMFTDEALLAHASGGSFPIKAGAPVSSYKWYSWIDMAKCRNAPHIADIIGEFFDEAAITDGEFWLLFDSKKGDEDVLLQTLAPFIEAGSYMEWRGEDGYLYRWEFDGTTMTEKSGEVVWM